MRILVTVLIAVGVAFATLVALVLLASVTGPRVAGEVELATITAPVEIGIDDDDLVHIRATNRADMFAALGYAHALRHAWAMTLWKTTASARRSATSPDSAALAADQLVALLGIPADARRSYRTLPDSLQAFFDAYAHGVNASFARNRLIREDEFIVLGLEHENWEPWHPIAIEMLLAYLASTSELEATTPDNPPAAVTELLEADAMLRATLGLDGFQHAVAFTAPDTVGTAFFHRLVYGNAGVPLVQPATLDDGTTVTMVTSIPGTLAFPGGFAEDRAWAFVPAARASFSTVAAQAPAARYDRVLRHDGSEQLVESRRMRGRLFLDEGRFALVPSPVEEDENGESPDPEPEPEPEPEAVDEQPAEPQMAWWTLEWQGLDRGTDIRAWLGLLDGTAPGFDLFTGGGIIFGPETGHQIFGNPAFATDIPGGVLVGGTEQAALLAERFNDPLAPTPSPESVGDDTYSAWAARIAPPLITAIGHPDSVDIRLRDPVAFLQGWNYHYDGHDIAASIFEQWMRVHRRNTGRLPEPDTLDLTPVERTDTLRVPFAEVVAERVAESRAEGRRPPAIVDTLAARPELADSMVAVTRTRTEEPHDLRVLKHAFAQAIDELEAAHGRAGAGWRWYQVQRALLRFPGRTQPPGAEPRGRRYRDVTLADGGHPTAVRWGPSSLFDDAAHAAAWSSWTSTATWDRVFILGREPFREPLDERYADPPPSTTIRIWTRDAPVERQIRLVPPA